LEGFNFVEDGFGWGVYRGGDFGEGVGGEGEAVLKDVAELFLEFC